MRRTPPRETIAIITSRLFNVTVRCPVNRKVGTEISVLTSAVASKLFDRL